MIQNKNKLTGFRLISLLTLVAVLMSSASVDRMTQAAEPTGADWFEFRADPFTGGDDTGDGGSGSASDFNYFYVEFYV